MHTLILITLSSSSVVITNELYKHFITFHSIDSFIYSFCSFNVRCSKFTIGIRSRKNAIHQVKCLLAIPTPQSKPCSIVLYLIAPLRHMERVNLTFLSRVHQCNSATKLICHLQKNISRFPYFLTNFDLIFRYKCVRLCS